MQIPRNFRTPSTIRQQDSLQRRHLPDFSSPSAFFWGYDGGWGVACIGDEAGDYGQGQGGGIPPPKETEGGIFRGWVERLDRTALLAELPL